MVTGKKYWYRVRAYTTDAGASASVTRAWGIPDTVAVSPFSASVSPSTVASNESFTLSLKATAAAAPAVTAWRVTWANGDIQTLTGPPGATNATQSTWSLTHAYAMPGPHFIIVQAQDGTGWRDPVAAVVNVSNAPPQVSGTASYTTATDSADLSVTGTDDGGAAALNYQWAVISKPTGGTVTLSPSNGHAAHDTTAMFNKAGVYVLRVTAADALGLASAPFQVSVTVQQTPQELFITPDSSDLNAGDTQQFSATGTDQFGRSIAHPNVVWSADHGTITAAGLYTASGAAATDTVHAASAGVTADALINITNSAPTIDIDAAASPASVTGTTTVLSVVAADDGGEVHLTYTWAATGPATVAFSGTPDTHDEKNATATFTRAGTYTFTATAKDRGGLTVSSSPVTVTVAATATVVVITPADVTLALNASQAFSANVADQFGRPVPNAAVTWQHLSGPGSLTANTFHAAATPGTATIRATSGSVFSNAVISIENAPPELSGLDYYTTDDTDVTLNVTGTDDGGASNLSYTWSVVSKPNDADDPEFSRSGTNAAYTTSVTFKKAGYYELSVTATDAGGLTADYSVSVDVAQTPHTLDISPISATLNVGDTQHFTATVKDQFQQTVEDPAVVWSAAHGTIDADGLYTASNTSTVDTVHAAIAGLTKDASITVALPAPTGLSGSAPNPTEANLIWADHSNGEDGFLIERRDDADADWTAVLTTRPNATGWSVTGLTPDTDYAFRVTAISGQLRGEGNTATVPTPAADVLPPGVEVEWDDGTTGESSAGNAPNRTSGSATVKNLIVGHDYHVSIGFEATGAWDGSGLPRNDSYTVGPDSFHLNWNGQEISSGTIVSEENLSYYGMNADYVDGPPPFEQDFTAGSTTATVSTSISVLDVAPHNNEGWAVSVIVTDLTPPEHMPIVSIDTGPTQADATPGEAWEVPLGSQQDDQLTFTVSRSGTEANHDFDQPLTVKLHLPAGLATSGDDYDGFEDTVTIQPGDDSAEFSMTANSDEDAEDVETVALCIEADGDYRLGSYTASGNIQPEPKIAIRWVARNSANSVTNLSPNTHLGGGERLFPDKDSPTDIVQHDLVDVEVTVTPTPPAGTVIYLRSFDVDDPNIDTDLKLDTNDDRGNGFRIPTGGDNRGTSPGNRGTFSGGATNYGTSVTTNAQGVATATFQVTMQPGDNFRIAAALSNAELDSLTTFAVGEPSGPYLVTPDNHQIVNASVAITDMLTVWRRLWIERDAMLPPSSNVGLHTITIKSISTNVPHRVQYVPVDDLVVSGDLGDTDIFEGGSITFPSLNGKTVEISSNLDNYLNDEILLRPNSFTATEIAILNAGAVTAYVRDDDDLTVLGTQGSPRLADGGTLLPSAFGDAYILPVYADAYNPNKTIPFQETMSETIGTGIWTDLDDAEDLSSTELFWDTLVVSCFQPIVSLDGDGDGLSRTGLSVLADTSAEYGAGPQNGYDDFNECGIFLETLRDLTIAGSAISDEAHTVAHEIGHTGGNRGHATTGIMMDAGPKKYNNNLRNDHFANDDLAAFRSLKTW